MTSKKGTSGGTVFVITALVAVAAILAYMAFTGDTPTAAAGGTAGGAVGVDVSLSGVSSGFTEDKDKANYHVIKFDDDDLNSSVDTPLNFTIELDRNDLKRDENSAGFIFSLNVNDLDKTAKHDSWNESVAITQRLIDYDTSDKEWQLSIGGEIGDQLPKTSEVKQGTTASIVVVVPLATDATFNNVVEDDGDDIEVATLTITGPDGVVQGEVVLEYTRSNA